jgi:antitoxin VapB
MAERIKKNLELDGQEIVSRQDWNRELDEKQQRISEWLKRKELVAVLLRRHENIAWATGGASEGRVRIPQETQVFSLLITGTGGRYYLAGKNEGPRLHDEEFGATDFEPVLYDWYADGLLSEARRLAGGKLATDYATGDLPVVNFYELREELLPQEIARYRWLGEEVAASTADVLSSLEPGMSDYEFEALTAAALLSGGVLPSVLLMGTDERLLKYKHCVARGGELKHYGMVNLCARKWGLVISITRYIHFGKLPAELADRFAAAAHVQAALLDATREGATSAQLFAVAKNAYAKVGHAEDIEKHHQGGATGYNEREWVATPAGVQVVRNSQAFAWNPSIKGTKVEDTSLLLDGNIETLTETPELPVVETSYNGSVYLAASILVRE